ncbi:hypothetical protein BD769DRAFT_1384514 [Suillus cothurnatus]|nr:hypothetical protein BD769DRAFT_1384514 [Suillus cothurnatus]
MYRHLKFREQRSELLRRGLRTHLDIRINETRACNAATSQINLSGCKNPEHVTNITQDAYDALILNQFSFPASYEDLAPIRDEAHIATLYQVTDFIRSDPNPNTSASGHSNSPDIDFNVQLLDDTTHTAYPEDFPNLLPPSQGPSSYWGQSDSDSQCSSLVPDSEINIEEQLLINMLDSLYNIYMAKVLLVTISTQQHWQLLCPDCQEWVQTSVSSQLPLWYPGQFSLLSSH